MKRILALILVIFMMIVSFASCARGVTELYDSDQSDTQQVIQTAPNNDNNLGSETTDDNSDESIENNDNNENNENKENNEDDEVNDNICSHEGGSDATCITESVCELCNQPYGGFDTGVHEGEAEWVSTDTAHKSVYSCCKKMISDEEAHTFVDGVCSVCEYECVEHESDGHSCVKCNVFVAHTYVNNKCSVCGLIKNGKSVTFGSYPKSKVTNSTIVTTLNNSESSWILSNGTWYADVTNGENKYRGVKTSENGTATWFKYEPISWTILEEKDGKALVLCDTVIEMLAFDESNSNNYAESTIRAWLNETFINAAFGELAKAVIATIEVDNSNASTGYVNARFTCDNTFDKIFLLSRAELKNTLYGFTTDGTVEDANRKKQASEYAIARLNGGYVATSGAWWWMRTGAPHASDTTRADLVHNIKINGTINNTSANSTTGGVVPVMWINV